MNPIHLVQDVRNTTVGFATDTFSFASHRPFSSICSLGTAPLTYATVQWISSYIKEVGRILSTLTGYTCLRGATLLKTAATPPTACSTSTWKWIPTYLNPLFQYAVFKTPPFQGYTISLPKEHPCHQVSLLNTSVRPANLLFNAIFKGTQINVTQPSRKGSLFQFNTPLNKVARFIRSKAKRHPHEVVSFSAKRVSGRVKGKTISSLETIYGSESYELSRKEIADLISSQRIYTSSLLPLPFYKALKHAMTQDGIVLLPQTTLGSMRSLHTYLLLKRVEKNPTAYGFQDSEHFKMLKELSLYQLGSMVVKSQDFYVLVDGEGQLLSRKADSKDAIRLVDMCGLRDFHSSKLSDKLKKQILKETFKTSLIAANKNIVLFPAVGLGVWKGDPAIYWNAFLEAVSETNTDLEQIIVNPSHGPTTGGVYKGFKGEEFDDLLKQSLSQTKTSKERSNLKKIYNLQGKDLVQLARELKATHPHKVISLVNASDPDVTLGNHVGEYTNSMAEGCTTTEENYTALGTNGLCFEGITGSQKDASRLFQT